MKKKGQYRAGPLIIAFWVPILRTKKHDFYMEPSVKFVLRINGSFSEKIGIIFILWKNTWVKTYISVCTPSLLGILKESS